MREEKKREECSIPCNLCLSTEVDILCLRDRDNKYLRTVICKQCGLIWTDPRPAEEKLKQFYSENYRKEYKNIITPKKKHLYRDTLAALKRYSLIRDFLKPGTEILDIGAGSGIFVYVLRYLGHDAKGIEPDRGHANYAADSLGLPIRNCFSEDLHDEHYDVIVLSHVLEHMTDPLAKLVAMKSLLKEGGTLIVDVPNAEDLKQDPQNRYHKAHIYTFNPETLERLGVKAGYRAVKKVVAPLRKNGNITCFFQIDSNHPNVSYPIPENYHRVKQLLDAHTTFRHYLTPAPYLKFIVNVKKAISEQSAIRGLDNVHELIGRTIDNGINKNSQ